MAPVTYITRGASIWVLLLLASLHLSAELGHFLIGVVSRYVARDIHYGTHACFVKRNFPVEQIGHDGSHFNISECISSKNQTE